MTHQPDRRRNDRLAYHVRHAYPQKDKRTKLWHRREDRLLPSIFYIPVPRLVKCILGEQRFRAAA